MRVTLTKKLHIYVQIKKLYRTVKKYQNLIIFDSWDILH